LTARTRETKHRDPLKTLEAAARQQKESEANGEKKVSKVFDSKDERD
jgi:hypothetical protein